MRILGVAAALGMYLITGVAHAGIIDLTTSGVFTNAEPATAVFSGEGTSYFTWGQASPTVSSLTFTGTTTSVDTDTPFEFGTLSYYNGTIVGDSGATSVDLTVSVDAGVSGAGVQPFDLGLINTLNIDYDPVASADYVTISADLGSANLTIGGEAYVLDFLGFSDWSGGGFSVGNEFHVYENQGASANLVGMLTHAPAAVPELSGQSSASALFLALGALAVLTSRRRSRD
ncbi:MAG: choice-of-anchor K domain-containing protein [Polyangiaceae bacterium]|nr:choice-of-anchor K domain-containing protein [Polyangiaceae bacterium]